MVPIRILVVEDEILIADTIERYLLAMGHQVVGKAASFSEACSLYHAEQPDLALLDIRLRGDRTGVDLAHYLRQQNRTAPFIFLTSQLDPHSLALAKQTCPAGYLPKPIRKESLYTTIEMATPERHHRQVLTLRACPSTRHIAVEDILYLQADHVYVRVHLQNGCTYMQRTSLRDLLEALPAEEFLQTHRSFAVNIRHITRWSPAQVWLQDRAVPVSRSYRKAIRAYIGSQPPRYAGLLPENALFVA